MRYDYFCPICKGTVEVVMPMAETGGEQRCACGTLLQRKYGFRVSKGHKQYGRPIISDSLAVSVNQIEEHKRMFPDIQVTPEGQPVFDNYAEHEKYLKKCNVVKLPGKKRKKATQTPTPRRKVEAD